jgi:hypothetical protein
VRRRAGEQLAHPTAEAIDPPRLGSSAASPCTASPESTASVLPRAAAERSLPLPPGLHDPCGRLCSTRREGSSASAGGGGRPGSPPPGGRGQPRNSTAMPPQFVAPTAKQELQCPCHRVCFARREERVGGKGSVWRMVRGEDGV